MNFETIRFKKIIKLFSFLTIFALISYLSYNSIKIKPLSATVTAFVCEPGGSESPIQTVRNFFYMSMGFPGADEYECFADFDQSGTVGDIASEVTLQGIVEQGGLVGRLQDIRSSVVSAIIANVSGITACSQVPTTGSFAISANETLTYGVASRTPPATYPVATAYDKKVTYVNSDPSSDSYGTSEFEFHCDRASMMLKYKRDLSGDGTHDHYIAVYYDGETTVRYLDFYMYDAQNIVSDNLSMVVTTRVDTTAQTLKLYQTRTGLNGANNFTGYRFAVYANYITQDASFYYHDVSGAGYTSANYASQPLMTSTAVVSANDPNSGNSYDPRQGCTPNFSTSTNSITSATTCTGLDLTAGPALAFTGSDLSMVWVQANLSTELNAL